MSKPITPETLKEIAFKVTLEQYNDIIEKLHHSASKGQKSLLIDNLSDTVQSRLIEEGYRIKPYVKYQYDYLLRKKRKKYYVISF